MQIQPAKVLFSQKSGMGRDSAIKVVQASAIPPMSLIREMHDYAVLPRPLPLGEPSMATYLTLSLVFRSSYDHGRTSSRMGSQYVPRPAYSRTPLTGAARLAVSAMTTALPLEKSSSSESTSFPCN